VAGDGKDFVTEIRAGTKNCQDAQTAIFQQFVRDNTQQILD